MIIIFSIITAVILIGSSYIITEKNAKYYLSGYWNSTPEKRQQIDLKGFLTNWKRIMWISGGLITLTGITLYFIAVSLKVSILIIMVMVMLSLVALFLAGRKV